MKLVVHLLFLLLISCPVAAQRVVAHSVLKEQRRLLRKNLVNQTILANLSLELTDSTESNWEEAIQAMLFLGYRSPLADRKINLAFEKAGCQSLDFQRNLLEIAYGLYSNTFIRQVRTLLSQTSDSRIFAMCAVYLVRATPAEKKAINQKLKTLRRHNPNDPFLEYLESYLSLRKHKPLTAGLASLKDPGYLKGNVLLISFQRKNRDYPGLAIVRDTSGKFIVEDARLVVVPQLARSLNGLPGLFSNGNTPAGVFRLDGIDTSRSPFIGPTPNLQLTMPFEFKARHFFRDDSLTDSMYTLEDYKKLLPRGLQNEGSLYESFFAGKAGRNEIIAHGTTVDPNYYKTKTYYPFIPTEGCLSTIEMWNEQDGSRMESGQQTLVDLVIRAGGPNGYALVIDLDDQHKPVTFEEISAILQEPQGR